MWRRWVFFCVGFPGLLAADDPSEIVFKPVPETGELEIGFWEGDGEGLGGHIRMKLEPFSVGESHFREPRLQMVRFQFALPCDLRAINDRTIDCDSAEFLSRESGRLELKSADRERIPMKPKSLRFLRTGNESVRLTMTGTIPIAGTSHPFVVESELKVGWSYGAPEGQVLESIIDEALQVVGIPDLPRRMDRTFGRGGTFIWLRLEPANLEVLETWMKRLPDHPGGEAITLPDRDPPDYWFFQAAPPAPELPRMIDLYPEFRRSRAFDLGSRTNRPIDEVNDGFLTQNLRAAKRLKGRMLLYEVAEDRDGWVVVFPDEQPNGKLFIFCFGEE